MVQTHHHDDDGYRRPPIVYVKKLFEKEIPFSNSFLVLFAALVVLYFIGRVDRVT